MFLTYDLGNNEFEDIGGETVRTGDTTARLDFDEVEREGTYFVQYLAPVPSDGHVIAGAISFTYGSPSTGSSDGFPIIPFVVGAVIVLAIGGWFSYRRMLVPVDDTVDEPDAPADHLTPPDRATDRSQVDQDLADVGVRLHVAMGVGDVVERKS